ncbi:MAG: methionyl-tRNA formyltransferase [Candidatus Omnitrophica bacterium]|nr:methionyl-tRNA formyltransferase [Candidatus Omnitrophota bacterium]
MRSIKRVLFMGSKDLGLGVLKEMVALSPKTLIGALTIDDKSDCRSALSDFKVFAKEKNIKLYVASNKADSERIIQELKPDLCFVVGWYWLISDATLDGVAKGFIGIHNSLLPQYRGSAPLVWAMMAGEKKVGFSLFTFTKGMDDGPIWVQGSVSVEDSDDIGDVLVKLKTKAVKTVHEKYPAILDGKIKPVAQKHNQATYCAQRLPSDGNINWSEPARKIYDFIRSQANPYPGAFTYYQSAELKIWRAQLCDKVYFGTPGQVAQIGKDGVYVICGDNRAIILKDIEFGGKRQPAQEILKTISIRFPDTKVAK